MTFETPAAVEAVIYDLLLAEYYRGRNRAAISDLHNGVPPFTPSEVQENQLDTNYNDLTATHINQQARGQFENALITPNPIVNVDLDYGPVWKRREWANVITRELNRKIKNNRLWMEEEQSTFAQVVLHGIAPAVWMDSETWVPEDKGVEDVLVSSGVYRSLKNLPFFAVYEQYTAPMLSRKISGPHVEPGWNIPLAKSLVEWAYQQGQTPNSNWWWPDPWKPEKWAEVQKEDSGYFASERVPTIDTYHFYYWCDEGKVAGWRKKIILDSWGQPGVGGTAFVPEQTNKYAKVRGFNKKNKFLFDSGSRVVADNLDSLAHWQFGDASSVAPFMYHSVRSLGFLLYAVCQLQNRLKCRFMDSAFEALMQYLRVGSPQDMDRALKINFINRGVIPDGVTMVGQNERWQINEAVVQTAMSLTRQTIADNSSVYTQDLQLAGEHPEETATKTMAKVNASTAMIGSMLGRAYNYQKFKYREVGRRFCIENSRDMDVRDFRLQCLKAGVPKEALNINAWNVEAVRVIGSGNKMMQVAMMDKLMFTVYDKLDGDAQNELKRLFVSVNSDDYDLARRLVPEHKTVSPTVNAAQRDAGTLMSGVQVTPSPGENEVDYIAAQLVAMATIVQGIQQGGNMATKEQVRGLGMLGQNIAAHIKQLAQDKTAKQKVKEFSDDLGKLMNAVKGFAQRLAEQQKQAGNGVDPQVQGKIQSMVITSQAKAKLAAESHAQKTAQRQIQFEQQVSQDMVRHKADLAKKELELASTVRKNGRMKSFEE